MRKKCGQKKGENKKNRQYTYRQNKFGYIYFIFALTCSEQVQNTYVLYACSLYCFEFNTTCVQLFFVTKQLKTIVSIWNFPKMPIVRKIVLIWKKLPPFGGNSSNFKLFRNFYEWSNFFMFFRNLCSIYVKHTCTSRLQSHRTLVLLKVRIGTFVFSKRR